MSGKVSGLSRPILSVLYSCKESVLPLCELRRRAQKEAKRRLGRKVRYLPISAFYRERQGEKKFIKALRQFVERRIILSPQLNARIFEKMVAASKKSEINKIWSELKGVSIRINKFELIRIAPKPRRVRKLAERMLRKSSNMSAAEALLRAEQRLEKIRKEKEKQEKLRKLYIRLFGHVPSELP